MKKILSILLVCLVLFGCTKKQEKPDLSKEFVIETYKADMSGYENLKSSGHMFVGTTVSELKRTVDEVVIGIDPDRLAHGHVHVVRLRGEIVRVVLCFKE